MKYITIKKTVKNKKRKTDIFTVHNKKSNFIIGIIKWYPSWRQYCFFPSEMTVYSYECLRDISNFITNLKKISYSGKKGTESGKALKDKITFEPNGPPPLFIKEDL